MTLKDTGPRRFGRYLLKQSIAKGGMAEIFLADWGAAAGLKKEVVVKRILPTFADDDRFVQMFIDEAAISVELSHGNIAQVFDFGEIDGEYFLSMEYIRGRSLSEVLRRATELELAIPPHIACYVVMELCSGLHYAHRRTDQSGQPLGIVHRDVSPQNVMISYEGQVKVVDFGIAKARNVASKTRVGAVKGKYLYFSPEQARARPLDGRSDVFAAGIVLYELITGHRPFKGPLIDVLRSIVHGNFARPSSLVPNLKPSLEKVILKAMATKPEDRYQTAFELQEALAKILYSLAPRFTSSGLAHYIRYLYREELTSQGISVDLPSDFLEQVPLWRLESGEGERAADDPSTEDTDPEIEREDGRTSSEHTIERSRTQEGSSRTRPVDLVRRDQYKKIVAAAAVTLGIIGIIAIAARTVMRDLAPPPRTTSGLVVLDSRPTGAQVMLDGGDTGEVTPLVLDGLEPGRFYAVTLSLEGYEDKTSAVVPDKEETTTVSLSLSPRQTAPDVPSVDELEREIREERRKLEEGRGTATEKGGGMDALAQVDSALQEFIRGSGASLDLGGDEPLELEAPLRRVTTDLRDLSSLRIRLNPERSYELSVSGSAFLGDPVYTAPSSEAFYVAARRRSAPLVGVVRKDAPVDIPAGAVMLHLLVAGFDPSKHEGRLKVRLVDDGGDLTERYLVASRHAFNPARHGATVTDELGIIRPYRVSGELEQLQPPLLYVVEQIPTISRDDASSTLGVLQAGELLPRTTAVAVFSFHVGTRPPARRLSIELVPN